ncbi:MAG: flippase-like domain-containing protein [Chloroflexia bacterium]|nr:flippase-like domain-containing protein [Chloroflexia bacterium]
MRLWRVWLGFAVSAFFLVVAFRGQDFGQIRDALSGVNYAFLPLALAFYFAGVWIRAVRWSVLLRPIVRLSARQIFPIVVVGFMANNVLPLRTGELVRSYALSSRHGVRKTSVLATIAVERLFDGLILLGFMLAATTVITFTSELRHLALVAFVLFAAVLIGLFALTLSGNLLDKLVQLVVGPLPAHIADRVERLAESFLSGLGVLKRSTDLAKVAGTSLLAWLLEASMYWILARGFEGQIREAVGVGATLLTTGVANLATLIPSSPGYIGQFEYGVKLVVNGALGVPSNEALAYAILVHAALYFPITIWGIAEWFRQHLSLGQVRDLRDDAAPSPPVAATGTMPGPSPRNSTPVVSDSSVSRH